MKDANTRVKAVCSKCGTDFKVDLDILCAMKGRGYSLIGRRGPCKKWGCDGTCAFLYSPREGTPFQPLRD